MYKTDTNLNKIQDFLYNTPIWVAMQKGSV
ncbi:hypothetical protein TUMEXPCC7403_24040 [Tumidithrix helvetica PCC 7403]